MQLIYAAGIFSVLLVMNRIGVRNLAFYLIPGVFLWYFVHHSGIHATIAGVLLALTIPSNRTDTNSPLENLEHSITKPVNLIIMPIFALANTNIKFENTMIDGLTSPLGLGIILGLSVGKPLGITILSWLAYKLKLAKLPSGATWSHIGGVGLLAGIGFTMSIFISLLSFSDANFQLEAKFSILVASVISGLLGFTVLNLIKKKELAG